MNAPHDPVLPAPEEKATAVRTMFDRIAPGYDRMNRLMTMGNDQRWRKSLVRRLGVGPGDRVLDVACGTGDFVQICAGLGAEAAGLDFSRGMIEAASEKVRPSLVLGDANHLPFGDGAFTVVVSGFALRNFASIGPVFKEMARVLAPGGRLGLLEVDEPKNRLIAAGHRVYFKRGVPIIGRVLSDASAYKYLPASATYLPPQEEMVRMLMAAGFRQIVKRSPMMGAIQSVSAVRI